MAQTTSAIVPQTAYAREMRAINPRLPEDRSRAYATALLSSSQRMHLDPRLVMAVVTIESHWNESAVSVDGAVGLGQLKPDTARRLGVDAWSGQSNIVGLTRYLHRLLGMFHSSRSAVDAALAGYNAGPLAVLAHGGTPPERTRDYVTKVVATWHALQQRLTARTTTPDAMLAATDAAAAVDRAQAAYWGAR